VILCTTTSETPEFYNTLDHICQKYGFGVACVDVEDKHKNPWAIYQRTLSAHGSILKGTRTSFSSSYIILIDGDTTVE
jgi:hypothetical protein